MVWTSFPITNNSSSIFFCSCIIDVLFSSPGPLVQVNNCHHFASVVCKLFTCQASSLKPLGQLEPNLPGMFLYKVSVFVPVGYSTWLPGPIICSDWLKFQRSSLKPLGQLKSNCQGMIVGRSSTKFMFFYSDQKSKIATTAGHKLTLDPMGKCSNAFLSETTNMIKAKLYINVHWMVQLVLFIRAV